MRFLPPSRPLPSAHLAVAGGQPHVVDVEGDDLADAQDRVAGVGVFLDGAQPAQGVPVAQRRHRCAADARAFATTTVPAEVLSGQHVGVRSGLPDDHRELVGQPRPGSGATPDERIIIITTWAVPAS